MSTVSCCGMQYCRVNRKEYSLQNVWGGKKNLPCMEYPVGSQGLYLEKEVNQQEYAEEQYQP